MVKKWSKKQDDAVVVDQEVELEKQDSSLQEEVSEEKVEEQSVRVFIRNDLVFGKTYDRGVHILSSEEHKRFIENRIDFKVL